MTVTSDGDVQRGVVDVLPAARPDESDEGLKIFFFRTTFDAIHRCRGSAQDGILGVFNLRVPYFNFFSVDFSTCNNSTTVGFISMTPGGDHVVRSENYQVPASGERNSII